MIFDFCMKHILEVEGGFSNNPNDRGGPTNFGITLGTLAAFRGKQVTIEELKNIKPDEVRDVYFKLFWQKFNLSLVKDTHMACIIFDQVVNRRAEAAIITLQTALNSEFGANLIVDGVLGLKTADAINKNDVYSLGMQFVKETQRFYVKLIKANPSQFEFMFTWMSRTWRLLDLLCQFLFSKNKACKLPFHAFVF